MQTEAFMRTFEVANVYLDESTRNHRLTLKTIRTHNPFDLLALYIYTVHNRRRIGTGYTLEDIGRHKSYDLEKLKSVLEVMSPNYRIALENRYGIECPPKTYEEIASKWGKLSGGSKGSVTSPYIHQLVRGALRRLLRKAHNIIQD